MDAPLRKFNHRQAAFSLIESIIAMAVGALALSSAFLLDSYQLRLVKRTREAGAASVSLEERVEQLRIATWRQITDSKYLSNTYFATVPRSVSPLDGFTERVTVSAWPDPDVCQPLVVEKRYGSAAQIISAGAKVAEQRLAKVDVQINWKSNGGQTRVRELTTVISNGGISRMNLPAIGSAAGVPPSATPSPTDPAPVSDSTPAPDASSTPVPAASPAAATPAATVAPSSKFNRRGTVGGKPGKA